MIEVVKVKTRADMRAFFKAAKHAGYVPCEERYLKRYAVPPLSLLSANGPQVYFVAKRDGRPVFRAITGIDFRYTRATGTNTGYFSLFDGENDREAIQAVLDEIIKKQRAWGMEEVIGPISPDASGFFMGAGEGDFTGRRGVFTGPDSSFQAEILRKNAFTEKQVENAFEISARLKNPLSDVTRKAEERFSVEVRKMRTGLLRDGWIKNILSVSKDAPDKEMRLVLERVRRYIDKKHSYLAFIGGVCAGYLISFKRFGNVLRATTLMTSPEHFSSPVVLSLIGRFLEETEKEGAESFEVSVINHQNIRSERLVLRFGGKKVRSYTLFTKKVGQN